MIERTCGVIIRIRYSSETSLILHWLTRDHGRVATVARGARRPKSPLLGKLDLFFLDDFTFRRSRTSTLHTLIEAATVAVHPHLRTGLAPLRLASYLVRLIERSTESDAPVPELYAAFVSSLEKLPSVCGVLEFEAALLSVLGGMPALEHASVPKVARRFLGGRAGDKKLWTVEELKEVGRFLGHHLEIQIGELPRERGDVFEILDGAQSGDAPGAAAR